MITLYIKESPRGKLYLGKTIRNPYTYNGSGLIWQRHLKKYNYSSDDIKTTILFQTENKELFKVVALYYSNLYNVVNSTKFVNLTEERGQGGKTFTKESHPNHPAYKWSDTMKSYWSNNTNREIVSIRMQHNNPMDDELNRNKISVSNTGKIRSEEFKQIQRNRIKNNNPMDIAEYREKVSNNLKGHIVSEETRRKISESVKKL